MRGYQKNILYFRSSDSNEYGFMAAEWMIGFALLLLPAFVIIFSMMQLPVRQNTTQQAASAAARAYVDALDQSVALDYAKNAAAQVIADETPNCNATQILNIINGTSECGLSANSIRVEPTNTSYCPGQDVKVSVSMPVPVTINPIGGGKFTLGFTSMSASASERIDDYAELVSSDSYDMDNDPCG